MGDIKLLVCPLGFCDWFWRYDASDPHSKERAKEEERKHWLEYHSTKDT